MSLLLHLDRGGLHYRDDLQVFRLRDYRLYLEGTIDEPIWASQEEVLEACMEMRKEGTLMDSETAALLLKLPIIDDAHCE